MHGTNWESLVEMPTDRFGPLQRVVPDMPWTTTSQQAIQNRKAKVYVDLVENPRSVVVTVNGGDQPGDFDQAYVFGLPSSESLRQFVASVGRSTEFIVDEELTPMILEIHPAAVQRDAICCWFEDLSLPAAAADPVPVRRLRMSDVEAAKALIPPWTFRTFESPREMIVSGACFAVELNGEIVSVAYVADQSIRYARIAAVTLEAHRRKGYAFAATRKLMEHVTGEGRFVCANVPRRNARAVHFALKLGFPRKALLRTYKVRPDCDPYPTNTTSSVAQTTS